MSLVLALCLAAQAAELSFDPQPLVEGQPVTVTSPALAGGELKVTYRPGTVVDEEEALAFDADGRATWTPRHAGLATLAGAAGEERAEQRVSVHYPAVPIGGVVVFLLAGTLLFGATAYGMRQIFAGEAEGLEVGQAPLDT